MNLDSFVCFDVESVGLHGPHFAVGAVFIEKGEEVSALVASAYPSGLWQDEDAKWVSENVPQWKQPWTHRHPALMRAAFWSYWQSCVVNGVPAPLVCDVPWPVEARFLAACIDDAPQARWWLGPYPLIDVASVRLAKGLDPLATEARHDNEKPAHDPLADARQSARLLLEAMKVDE